MVAVYRQTCGASWLAWSNGRQPLVADLHSSDELGELLQ